MPPRDADPQPLPFRSAPAQARHVGRSACFVDEDEPRRVELELVLKPVLAPLQDIRPVLLRGMGGLFFTVMLQRSRKVQIVPTLALMPRSAAGAAASR